MRYHFHCQNSSLFCDTAPNAYCIIGLLISTDKNSPFGIQTTSWNYTATVIIDETAHSYCKILTSR